MTDTARMIQDTPDSLLTEKEVDERFIKKIVGHKGQGVTENVYTHIELPTKLEAINLI